MSDEQDYSDPWYDDDDQQQQDDDNQAEEREQEARMRDGVRKRDEEDHEDFYDRYHNWPDDPAMAVHPGSAAWKKLQGGHLSMPPTAHPGNVKTPEPPTGLAPDGNVRPAVPSPEELDGNR